MPERIELTQGKFAIVDDSDYEHLSSVKWCAHKERCNKIYAVRGVGGRLNRRIVRMHVYIMNPPDGLEVDHINGNGLDNQRHNLRICTHAQNLQNSIHHSDGTSPFKGVSYCRDRKLWTAQIKVDGKKIFLGRYANAKDGAKIYDDAAKKYFGKFAKTNF